VHQGICLVLGQGEQNLLIHHYTGQGLIPGEATRSHRPWRLDAIAQGRPILSSGRFQCGLYGLVLAHARDAINGGEDLSWLAL
jgi:hypothetical protein